MIGKIIFLREFRKVLQAGDMIEFRPGINLIVGEQGTGKSSLYKMLVDFIMGGDLKSKHEKESAKAICEVFPTCQCQIRAFDHEKQNPRTMSYFGDDIGFQVGAMFSSHGQSVNALNSAIALAKGPIPSVFIMDEPDTALSIRSIYGLLSAMNETVKNGNQVIVVVHNPILIAAIHEVFDMGQKKWVKSKDFIASMTPPLDQPLPRPWENRKQELEQRVKSVSPNSSAVPPKDKIGPDEPPLDMSGEVQKSAGQPDISSSKRAGKKRRGVAK